jgi:hypothetical protein
VQGASLVRLAAGEVFGRPVRPAWLPWAAGLAATAVLGAGTWYAWPRYAATGPPQPAAIAAPAAEPVPEPLPELPAPAAPVALAELLLPSAGVTGRDDAWSSLLGLWGAQYAAGGEPPCAQALRQGLECLEEGGGLEALRSYNRPAILPLFDTSGGLHEVVLTQLLDADRVQLIIGGAAHDIALAEIQSRWGGAFQLLWKPSQLDTRDLSLGMWGEPVLNLRTRLNAWAGLTADAAPLPDYFDEPLQQLVTRFQAANGLAVDGIAGARTQALLDAAVAGAGTPLLTTAPPALH